MEFRTGNKNDIADILELYKQLIETADFSANIDLEHANKTWEEIENNNIKYFLAEDNGKIIGLCYICIIPNLTYNGKPIGYIENVIVDKNYRKKGIGRKIMEMAIEYAKENNCYKAVLQSGAKRTEAHKFYEKIGFNGESKKAYELRFIK